MQQARNLALTLDERFEDIRFLIRDRGSNFTRSFDAVFEATGTTILRSAVQAPRMTAICERLVGTLRLELLDRVLIVGEAHLRAVLAEYQVQNTARPHQGIAHHATVTDVGTRQIRRKPVLDGLINEYLSAAYCMEGLQVTGQILFSNGTRLPLMRSIDLARGLVKRLARQRRFELPSS